MNIRKVASDALAIIAFLLIAAGCCFYIGGVCYYVTKAILRRHSDVRTATAQAGQVSLAEGFHENGPAANAMPGTEKIFRKVVYNAQHGIDAYELNKILSEKEDGLFDRETRLNLFKDVPTVVEQFQDCVQGRGENCVVLDYSITVFTPRHTQYVEYFVSQLKQIQEPRYVIYAMTALSRIGDSRAVPALVNLLTRAEFSTRNHAAEILVNVFEDDWAWRSDAVDAIVNFLVQVEDKRTLVLLWDQTKYTLLKQLNSDDKKLREQALLAFFRIGDQRVVPDLIAYFEAHADSSLVETYMTWGNKDLSRVAAKWAEQHGYVVYRNEIISFSSGPSGWGEM